MKTKTNSSRRKGSPWRSPILYSSLALVCSCQLAMAFQTSSLRALQQKRPSLPASGIDVETGNARQGQPSRTWDVPRKTNTNGAVGPILTDTSPVQRSNQNVSGQPRKKMKPMPVTGYDAQSILNFYDRRPLQVGWRLNSLGFPLLGWYLGLLIDKAMGIGEKPNVQRKRGEQLRQHLVRSQSVALIKVSGKANLSISIVLDSILQVLKQQYSLFHLETHLVWPSVESTT